jgi:hypothetical protein
MRFSKRLTYLADSFGSRDGRQRIEKGREVRREDDWRILEGRWLYDEKIGSATTSSCSKGTLAKRTNRNPQTQPIFFMASNHLSLPLPRSLLQLFPRAF